MGQKTKVGKQRKDKFYRLAKETGFRSRAAFKLLQLNRKFGFLENSRVLIDLCAAPGGWMQVAKQNMPVSSIIVGVDLYPIKPVPGCISIVEDITTEKCKSAITKALQTWNADVVLHDGAPNVGTNWIFDAYQQACLTLSALKLATEFLREGGWFITKIFRSQDYNSLLWVFKQLFNKVQATKPQASRSESAEIFVVCQYFKAPDSVDPKFFQPQYVFKELDVDTTNKLTVFHPDKQKKAKPEGYKEGDYTLFHSVKVSDFIKSENTIEILQKASEIIFDDEEILNHPKTTNEIKECFKDIKVLNRKDVRSILTWWKAVNETIKEKKKNENITAASLKDKEIVLSEGDEEEKELNEIDRHIAELKREELREQKKKKRAVEKERRKLQEKLNLKMVLQKNENPGLEEENDIFRLDLIKSKSELNHVLDQKPDVTENEEDEHDEYALPKAKKVTYDKEKTHLDSSGTYYKEEESESESQSDDGSLDDREGLGLDSDSDGNENVENSLQKVNNENPLLTDLDYRAKKEKRLSKAALWFEKENLKNLETEMDEDYDLDILTKNLVRKGKKIVGDEKLNNLEKANNKIKDNVDSDSSPSDDESSSDEVTEGDLGKKKAKRKMRETEGTYLSGPKRKLDEQGLALGSLMVSSNKKKRDLIDGAWNRYSFNDENLPDWFVQEEKLHMTQQIPVPPDMVQEYRNKLKEINARPIKKIIEAKARKKRRLLKSFQKAKKKMENIMDNVDISEREKVRSIQKLYKKAKAKTKKEVTYVVAKKSNTGKKIRRPKGVKGPYKVVDARMKKDSRRLKNTANSGKRKRKQKK